MTLNLFDQFATPQLLGIPLLLLALFFPTIIIFHLPQLRPNRMMVLQTQLILLLTKQMMRPLTTHGQQWALPLIMVLLYLLTSNLAGLLPYTFTPTTQLAMNMGLAIPMWLTTVLVGLRHQPAQSLAHMLPLGTPGPLIPILILIETTSLFIRPLALGVRLTANLTAGHLLIMLISTASLLMMNLLPVAATLTLTLLVLLSLLELAVAMIQAYVFVLLISLYLQENT